MKAATLILAASAALASAQGPIINETAVTTSTLVTLTTSYSAPWGTGASSSILPTAGNSTYTSGSATATPVGPTATTTPGSVATAGASANKVGGALAAVGLLAAALL